MSKKTAMHVCAALTVVLWALGFVMTRLAVRHFSAEAVAFLRYFIAAVSLAAFAVIKKLRLPSFKDVPLFFLGGAIGFAVYVYAINTGSKTLMASVVSFIVSASPIITALLARALLRERIGLVGWISVVFAFTGVGAITYFNGGFALSSGVIWVCFATVLVSFYNIYQRKLLPRYSPLEITTYCIVAGAILLSVFAPRSFPELFAASPEAIVAIMILGVFSGGIAYLSWAHALSKAERTSEVTNYMFVTPILTTFLGFVLAGEAPHVSAYIGGAMVLASVVMINRRKADTLHPFALAALASIRAGAKTTETDDRAALKSMFVEAGYTARDINRVMQAIFTHFHITVNFHPDRYGGDGRLVIESLIDDGIYRNQFETNTTTGGRTAYEGGERDNWERSLFGGAYHAPGCLGEHRPKYGALDLLNNEGGATPRFGSCCLVLRPHVAAHASFAYGDSSTNPTALGTRDAFLPLLRALLSDVEAGGKLLDGIRCDVAGAIGYLLRGPDADKRPARLIEYNRFIETHIHGELRIGMDAEALCADTSFADSEIRPLLELCCARHGLRLEWIPPRRVCVEDIDDEFRGPLMKPLAREILTRFDEPGGYIDARIIGRAARATHDDPQGWSQFGDPAWLFQRVKQLWHIVANFG